MAVAFKSGPLTPADELRQLLSKCEDRLINLSGTASVAELYGWLDQIAALWPPILATGADVRAEQARWQSLQERMAARAAKVLQAWQGRDQLAAARVAENPAEANWWWWIDRRVAEQRRRRLRRGAVAVLVAIVVLAVAALVLPRLFPVDPVVREAYRLQLRAESEMAGGDVAAGYRTLSQAIDVDPNDPNLLILHGAAADILGESETAAQSWQQARTLLGGDEVQFLTQRGLSYTRLGRSDLAIADLETATALDPEAPRAHLVLGSALEEAGRLRDALAAYERAADLAEAAGSTELVVMTRVQIANLLPRLQPEIPSTPQP